MVIDIVAIVYFVMFVMIQVICRLLIQIISDVTERGEEEKFAEFFHLHPHSNHG